MQEEVKILKENDTLECILSCDLDHHHARGLRETIDHALFVEKPRLIVLDFSAVSFMDSSGIAFVLGRASTARAIGGSIFIRGLSGEVRRLFALSSIEKQTNITIE